MGRKPNNDFLVSPAGEEFLRREYCVNLRSTYDIARELNTYATKVWRALYHHEIPRRSFSEAQSEALKSGRHSHPTAGKERSQDEREAIKQGVLKASSHRQQA